MTKLMFVERGVRGGVTSCIHRHAVANNKHLPDSYNPNLPNAYLLLLDCTNLYGTAMSQYKLPYGDFEWVDARDIDVKNLPNKDSQVGFLLDVDVYIPEHLHEYLDELPPLPEKLRPPTSTKGPAKLLTTLMPKKNYVIHYLLLKQAMDLGVIVEKVNRVLKFSQSNWLTKYVDTNAELRKNSKNNFEDNLFKLMSNAVYGKFLEKR
uniref:DNA-directed DNA polymerase n=1 Tax=Lygus hesperus TaxID=30085 RepID=A0A0K8TFS9_LYGHE